MNKLRTTPNAWNAALAATSGNVRAWLETQAETFPSCVNLNIDANAPIAAQAADALRAGTYGGRTKGAVQKIIDALTGTVVETSQASATERPSPVSNVVIEEVAPAVSVIKIEPVATVPAPTVEPVSEPEPVETQTVASEIDLILNPRVSIRDAMKALSQCLKND